MLRVLIALMATLVASACEDKAKTAGGAAGSATGSQSAVAAAPAKPKEAPPGGCRAAGKEPARLGVVHGDVYGFAQNKTHIFYTHWDMYGARGDLGWIRKDGEGARTLTSLSLEPRGLALDGETIYYTAGIRLLKIPVEGGEEKTPAPQFSAQAIAAYAGEVYGVPGDYGPYDRVAKLLKSGKTEELASVDRPATNASPNGYSALAVDASGIYVTDSGGNRILHFPLNGGKPKTLAKGLSKPYDLELVGDRLYFNLARKGELWSVSTGGGGAKKLATGLALLARIAADSRAVIALVASSGDESPQTLSSVALDGGEVQPIAKVPASEGVSALLVDADCVYWAQRKSASEAVVFAKKR